MIDFASGRVPKIVKGFEIRGRVGNGAFGNVYLGICHSLNQKIAIKINSVSDSRLEKEAVAYEKLKGYQGIPALNFYQSDISSNYLGIELLGPSISDLVKKIGGKITLKTALMIADQILTILQILRLNNMVHCDIKPENFVIGRHSYARFIYMIDYGLCEFVDFNKTELEREAEHPASFKGSARFASRNCHKEEPYSSRDDLESLGYMLIYLLNGSLPWDNLKTSSIEGKLAKIAKYKNRLSAEKLCQGLPKEFEIYMKSVRNLKFEEVPDYAGYRALFRDLFIRENYVYDYIYDWMELPSHDRKIHTQRNSLKLSHGDSNRVHLDAGRAILRSTYSGKRKDFFKVTSSPLIHIL